jgi:hypothetical protein
MSGKCAWFMTDLATEPDQGAIHLSGTPAMSITEAAECRSVCKPDRAWKPGANRGSLERTQRIAWVAALAQLGREHILVRCQAEPALSRSAPAKCVPHVTLAQSAREAFASGAGGSRSCGRQLERAASQDLWKALGVRDRRMGSR